MKAHHSQRHLSLLCLPMAVQRYTLVITLNMPNKVRVCDIKNAPFNCFILYILSKLCQLLVLKGHLTFFSITF